MSIMTLRMNWEMIEHNNLTACRMDFQSEPGCDISKNFSQSCSCLLVSITLSIVIALQLMFHTPNDPKTSSFSLSVLLLSKIFNRLVSKPTANGPRMVQSIIA